MSDAQLQILLQYISDWFTAFVQLFVSSWEMGFAYLAALFLVGLLVWASRIPWIAIRGVLNRAKQ